jgi:SpoVK/Ycf46/Vps4 family AAA+-type ATPase
VLGFEEDTDVAPAQILPKLRALHKRAEATLADAPVPDCLRANVQRIADLVGLDPIDCRILEFVVMLHSERLLDDTADNLGQLSSPRVVSAIAGILSLPEPDVRAALRTQSVLSRCGLVVIDRRGAMQLRSKLDLLSDDFSDLMRTTPEVEPLSLLRGTVAAAQPSSLALDDFEHIGSSLRILLPYLRRATEQSRRGVNFLLHGKPGVGKSELSRTLATAIDCPMYEVASADSDGDPINGERRLRAYRAAQSFFGQQRALITFDEVEDVFNDGDDPFGRRSTAQMRKAWLNRMLEENPVPTLWLSNSMRGIDPAFIRRFDMVFEVPVPGRLQRRRILRNYCGDLVDETRLSRIAEAETLAPAVVARAASVVRTIGDELNPREAGEALERLISGTLEAQGHPMLRTDSDPNRLPEIYSPEFIHADADLESVAQGIRRAGSARLLLSGPPGTGKTAYGRWLAEQLSVPLVLKRASDLMSKWVGENEQNIAAAFREARAQGALLLIDEIDSFVQDRRGAERSWELTMVNEWLTQLESFGGLFVGTTNLIDGIDQAALRRFDLKVRFDYLRADQAVRLFDQHRELLGLHEPDPAALASVRRLDRLTPGDFAAVMRQHRFRPIALPSELAAALGSEVAVKGGRTSAIGFV